MVFIVFARWLYKRWFLFLDDLTVATGRPEADPPGQSNGEDVVGAVRHSSIPFRNKRSHSTMGLRANAVAGSAVGAEGATLFDSVVPLYAQHVGAMLALMLVTFLAMRVARRHLFVLWSLVLMSRPILADAMDLDAVNLVVVSTVAVLGGSGWMYGAGKTIQVGREMIDASADLAESTIATGKQMTEAIVEDSA